MDGHLGRGMLLSFLLHGSFIFPVVVLAIVFARREADQRDLDVRFEAVSESELPDNLPDIERDSPATPDKLARRTDQEIEAPPPDRLPPMPEAMPPPEEQKPPPPPADRQNKKMVDLDMGKETEPPPDAKYLAQKNNRAEEETRARDTNLEREQKGTAGSSPSDRKDEEVGDAERKIAKAEDMASKRGRKAPEVTPHTDPQLPKQPSPAPRKSLLAMRDAPKRLHEVTPETADPTLPRDPEGLQSLAEERPEAVRDLGGAPGDRQSPRLSITGKQYQFLFGDDAEAVQRLAQKERSRRPGRFSERLGQIKSALENFIPEVRPGNQTALNTRAAPFAAFIARMHRHIHELWGFGFLEDLDSKPASSPLNNPSLITKLEIVLNADGTIAKVTIVRASGLTQFDVAAIDAVYSAGPFADPPREIRSGNGKIYIHWTFHRDERQCATSGVDYYILDNASSSADKGEPETSQGLPTPQPSPRLKRLERQTAPDSPARQAKRRQLDQAVGEAAEEPDHDATRRATQQVVRADDPAARAAAASWFEAYTRGDVGKMLTQATLPFRSSSGIAARTSGELRTLFTGMLEESTGPRKLAGLQLYSPAGARSALGGLPPGFDDPGGVVFAIAEISGETFVLVLAQKSGAWKASGLVRR